MKLTATKIEGCAIYSAGMNVYIHVNLKHTYIHIRSRASTLADEADGDKD